MPYKVNPATGEVESAAGRDLPAEIFTDLDRLDDDQIVAELKGGVIEEYVYSFPQGGTQIVGLSWVGAREAARHYQGIHVGEPKIAQDDESITIMVQVTDRMRDLVLWGASCVPKKMKAKGELIPDIFAFNKALSKAQRNGLIAVLPTAVIVKTIQAFLDAKKGVRQVHPQNGQAQPNAAPVQIAPTALICADCQKPIVGVQTAKGLASAESIAAGARTRFARALCYSCGKKAQAVKDRESHEAAISAETIAEEVEEPSD